MFCCISNSIHHIVAVALCRLYIPWPTDDPLHCRNTNHGLATTRYGFFFPPLLPLLFSQAEIPHGYRLWSVMSPFLRGWGRITHAFLAGWGDARAPASPQAPTRWRHLFWALSPSLPAASRIPPGRRARARATCSACT